MTDHELDCWCLVCEAEVGKLRLSDMLYHEEWWTIDEEVGA